MRIRKDAAKALAKMPPHVRARFHAAFHALEGGGPEADAVDTRPVVGRRGYRRVRVGDWRAIYALEDGEVVVTEAGCRGDMYKH